MASPTLSAKLDKDVYSPGEKMTLTVEYADSDNRVDTLTITGTDQEGNATTVTVSTTISDPVIITVQDESRTWTRKSFTGSREVWEATA